MKCEICEKEGTNYVSSRYGRDVYLCEDHRLTVLEYIESLKPKVRVERIHGGYQVDAGVFTPHGRRLSEGSITKGAAEALYEFMRREREG